MNVVCNGLNQQYDKVVAIMTMIWWLQLKILLLRSMASLSQSFLVSFKEKWTLHSWPVLWPVLWPVAGSVVNGAWGLFDSSLIPDGMTSLNLSVWPTVMSVPRCHGNLNDLSHDWCDVTNATVTIGNGSVKCCCVSLLCVTVDRVDLSE